MFLLLVAMPCFTGYSLLYKDCGRMKSNDETNPSSCSSDKKSFDAAQIHLYATAKKLSMIKTEALNHLHHFVWLVISVIFF